MKTKLVQLWIHLRASFWFIPALMILGSSVLALFLIELDGNVGINLAEQHPRIFGANAEGARNILSSVSSSMISITGVTFSITIVALSLASGQYTSRILRNFMRDRANQVVLGVFLSIFVYCLIVLRTIRGGEHSFVPSLSVVTGIAFGIVGVAFLIFFIHHVATSIQASTIISRIAKETLAVIEELYPDEQVEEDENPKVVEECIQCHSWTNVPSLCTGYVQTVDKEGLIEWAEKKEIMARMTRGIGEFLIEGKPILTLCQKSPLDEETIATLASFFSVASFRTIEQDAAFGIRQLVDIALKALSPGVNDTTTAVTCLHYLGAILEKLSHRKIPHEICRRNGKIVFIARSHTYSFFLDEALHQIRQDAKGSVATYLSMLETIEAATSPKLSPMRRQALSAHLQRIKKVSDDQVEDDLDRQVIQKRFEEVTRILQEKTPA